MRGFAADNSCHRASTDTFLLLENLWMKEIADCHLYGILDLGYVSREAACGVAVKMIDGGIDVLQLRAKKLTKPDIVRLAKELTALTASAGVPLIINDYPYLVA